MTSFEIGYNRRHWVTFDIKDATPEEIALLRQHEQSDYSEEVFTMLSKMSEDGRLSDPYDESSEDMPQYFDEHQEPNIISVEEA